MKLKLRYSLSLDVYNLKVIIKFLFVKMIFETINENPYLCIYLFKKKVYTKRNSLIPRVNTIINIPNIVRSTNISTEISYGFKNPCTTGLMFGAISTFFDVDQNPNFLPQYDYIIIDGTANLYLWTTMINYIQFKRREKIFYG